MLAEIITLEMLLKRIEKIMNDVIGERIPYKRLPFEGVKNPGLNKFWDEVM